MLNILLIIMCTNYNNSFFQVDIELNVLSFMSLKKSSFYGFHNASATPLLFVIVLFCQNKFKNLLGNGQASVADIEEFPITIIFTYNPWGDSVVFIYIVCVL